MNEKEFIRSIAAAWQNAKTIGVELSFTLPTSLEAPSDFRNIARDPDALYEDVYLLGLKTSSYNIALNDYSYFQFSMSGDSSFRFAYYPNPFIGASDQDVSDLGEFRELLNEGSITLEEYLHMVAEIRRSQHAPLLRYENSPGEYEELRHPCSHFHFGHHGGNRWPVKRVLTPNVFSLIVFKMFYARDWTNTGLVKKGGKFFSLEEIYTSGKDECSLLPLHLFSNKELRQFYMA
jgi:hypothetical protein